jgi:hypothetical protein
MEINSYLVQENFISDFSPSSSGLPKNQEEEKEREREKNVCIFKGKT